MIDFLKNQYAPFYGKRWDDATMTIRMERPASAVFEIKDKEPQIVQPAGKGVSVIRRGDVPVVVIDVESFTSMIHNTGNTPSACDFVICPVVGNDVVIFNELTCSESKYVKPYHDPYTAEDKEGKMEYAKGQIEKTLDRFYSVGNFLDAYNRKVALFSCRLTDKPGNSVMARSCRKFSKVIYSLEHIKTVEKMKYGFQFHVRIYGKEFII